MLVEEKNPEGVSDLLGLIYLSLSRVNDSSM